MSARSRRETAAMRDQHRTAGVMRKPRAYWLPGSHDPQDMSWPRFGLVIGALLLLGAAVAYFWPHS